MRQEYEMTEDDLAVVLEACQPVVWLAPHGPDPTSPQAYANDAWRALGHKMGFDWMTAKSVAGKGNRFFTAEKSAPTPMQATALHEYDAMKAAGTLTCIREIVVAWLKANGYDGLCNTENECGCTLDDLIPCNAPHETDCQAGYAGKPNLGSDRMLYLTREAAEAAEKEQDDG